MMDASETNPADDEQSQPSGEGHPPPVARKLEYGSKDQPGDVSDAVDPMSGHPSGTTSADPSPDARQAHSDQVDAPFVARPAVDGHATDGNATASQVPYQAKAADGTGTLVLSSEQTGGEPREHLASNIATPAAGPRFNPAPNAAPNAAPNVPPDPAQTHGYATPAAVPVAEHAPGGAQSAIAKAFSLIQVKPSFGMGFTLPFRSLGFLFTHKTVKRYAVLPLLVNFVVYGLVLWWAIDTLYEWDLSVQWNFWWKTGEWLSSALNWVTSSLKWIVAVPTLLIFCYYTFTFVGMLIASPFNDMLSERVERALCEPEEQAKLGLRLSTKAMTLSFLDSLWIIVQQGLWSLLTLPLLLIPVVGFLPLFFVSAYFTALGFFDIAMARNYFRARHKRPIIRQRFWQLMGLGLVMQLLFMVPLVGLLMLPLGVTAGTLIYCNCDWTRAFQAHQIAPPPGFRPPTPRERIAA